MAKQKLNPKILLKLKKKFPKKTENNIHVTLSKLSRDHRVPLNAAAEIWAKREGFSVWGLLDDKDRDSLKDKNIQVIKTKVSSHQKSKNIPSFITYPTGNKFLKAHIEEINRCYHAHGYTASFIIIRKVIENLIVEIIKKKFPNKTKQDKEIYLNFDTGHTRDLSEIIDNLRKKSTSFDPDEKQLVQRILSLSEKFKNDANDKTHSLYHISSKKELDDSNPQQILDLIKEFFEEY
ncbi:MAG: hypothetical protein Q7S06_00600 [Nanoarchaeota archaeon]|nr:hypothetical protein [Nanoarchaeota archaeon]